MVIWSGAEAKKAFHFCRCGIVKDVLFCAGSFLFASGDMLLAAGSLLLEVSCWLMEICC